MNLIGLWMICLIGSCQCARSNREFINQKFENCLKPRAPITMYPSYPLSSINKVSYSGYAIVPEQINGSLSLILDMSKCDFSMKNCEKYSTRNIPGICQILDLKDSIFAGAFVHVKPAIECPLKAGNYTLGESSIDMTALSMMQLDGYVWSINFRLIASENGGSKRRIILCVNSDTKVVRIKTLA